MYYTCAELAWHLYTDIIHSIYRLKMSVVKYIGLGEAARKLPTSNKFFWLANQIRSCDSIGCACYH